MERKPVTAYIDYRVFLKDYYEYEKKHTKFFSHRYFALKAGISSSSFLSRVIDGKRNLTRPMIEKFSKALKLTEKEAVYFRNLVLFNQARTSVEKNECYAVLRSMKGIIKETVLQIPQYEYFKNWYTPVIRELICIRDFHDDYAQLARMVIPVITAKEARETVNLLLDLGLIKKNADRSYVQTQKAVTADSQVHHLAVKSYTDAMLKHSQTALHTMDKSIRHISTMTLGVTAAQYSVLTAELEAFKERVKQIVTENDDASQVYQLNFALFPVSKSTDIQKDCDDEPK